VIGSLLAFILLVAVLMLAWAGPLWRPRPVPGVTRARPWLLGHRGARGPRAENTVPAFELALRAVDGIETDVQRTRDGHLVLWHDFDCHGLPVDGSELADLRAREPDLATLDDLVEVARAHPGTLLNLEIKSRPRPLRGWALERDLARAVRAAGLADRVLISSFDPLALARVRLLAPRLRTGLLTAPDLPSPLHGGALARWLHVDALHPEDRQVDAGLLAFARNHDLPLHVWTVNDPRRMQELARAGVGGIIGDDPTALARIREGGAP
jgi:glycerophosphoryl diester phosphodiesterase